MRPSKLLPQLMGMMDGKRWFSSAGTVRRLALRKPEAGFAIALGCEERFAPQLVHSRLTGIGVTCRL